MSYTRGNEDYYSKKNRIVNSYFSKNKIILKTQNVKLSSE